MNRPKKIANIMDKVAHFVERYYIIVLIAAIALTGICFKPAVSLLSNIDTDFVKLLPQEHNSVKSLLKIRDKFKSTKNIILVLEGTDPEKTKQDVKNLSAYLDTIPSVGVIEYEKRGYDFFDKHKFMFIDLDDLQTIRERIDRRIQKEKLGGLLIDFGDAGDDEEFKFGDIEGKYKTKYTSGATSRYYTNDDGTIYSIYVYTEKEPEGIAGARVFLNEMHDVIAKYQEDNKDFTSKIYFTGGIRTQVDEYTILTKDLTRAGIISGVGIFLILLLYFRRFFAPIILFLPMGITVIVSFAFASLHVKNLNLVTSFIFAILGGLGVEIGIHMLARYIEERRKPNSTMHAALFAVLYHTGGSALTSAASVAATFLILIVNDFKGFSEFGYIAGFGLVINYFCYIIVFPSLLVLAEKIRILTFKRSLGFDFSSGKDAIIRSRFPVPKFILAALALLAVVTIINIPRIKFEWKFSNLKSNAPSALEAKSKQRETSKSVNRPAIVLIKSREEAEAIKTVLEAKAAANPDKTVFDAFKSYYDLVPSDQSEKMGVIHEVKQLLSDHTIKLVKGDRKKDLDRFKEELNKAEVIEPKEVPPTVAELFLGNDGNVETQIAYINPKPRLELDDGRNAIEFSEEIGEVQTPIGTFYPSSDAIVFADVLKTMIRDSKRVVVLAFFIVFLIVYADFRSVKKTLFIISPIALGILYMFEIMTLFGLKLNFYNMVVIPTAVGTSIDNSIHIYHRYKELGKGSIMEVLKSSGGASLMSSLTNIFGFLGLVFTSHAGLRSIGSLAVAGLTACLITTLVYFPAMIQFIEDRAESKALEKSISNSLVSAL